MTVEIFPKFQCRLGRGNQADQATSMSSLTISVFSLHFSPLAFPNKKKDPALKLLAVYWGSHSMFIQTVIPGGCWTPTGGGWSMDDDGEESGSDPE